MAISKMKRRYNITLTPANVDRFNALAKEMGMPPGTLSNALDDCVKDLADVFQMAKNKGSLTLKDLSRLMGKQMELAIDLDQEGRLNREVKQKRNSAVHPVKPA